MSTEPIAESGWGEGGGEALPYMMGSCKRLIGICRWMESHFHDWIDYNGVALFRIFRAIQFFKLRTRMFVLSVKIKVFFIHQFQKKKGQFILG